MLKHRTARKNSSSEEDIKDRCVNDVLFYYNQHGRHSLPWRKKINPYRIIVSEIMLQQTQVSRVISKFEIWIKKYPTLASLRNSSLREVLILWQGLGYQRRAKALLSIAKENEKLPKHFEDLIKLPGVGIYTASAVCAFAYNQFSHPVLETNIRTVLIEYFHNKETKVEDHVLYNDLLWLEDDSNVKKLGARKWYYALMDYGAFLEGKNISHNKKSARYIVQSPYKGSLRELRAKVLFAIIHKKSLPKNSKLQDVLKQLEKEKYLIKKKSEYVLREI